MVEHIEVLFIRERDSLVSNHNPRKLGYRPDESQHS
jgi:hypothetical protein